MNVRLTIAALALLSAGSVAAQKSTSTLPSAAEIRSSAIDAIGGQKAWDKVQTLHIRGEMRMRDGTMTFETMWSRSGAVQATLRNGKQEIGHFGTNGDLSWARSPAGVYQLVKKEDIADMTKLAEMYVHLLQFEDLVPGPDREVRTTGLTEVGGRSCLGVHTTESDETPEEYYFDAKSRRLVGILAHDEESEMTRFTSWRSIKGVLFPHRIRIREGQPPEEMVIRKVAVNSLDDEAFATPAAVIALDGDEAGKAKVARAEQRVLLASDRSWLGILFTGYTIYIVEHGMRAPDGSQWDDQLLSYVENEKRAFTTAADREGRRAYAMNEHLSGKKMTRLKDEAKTVLFFECPPGSPAAGGPELFAEAPRYDGGYLVLFVDGHYAQIPKSELDTLVWKDS